MSFWHKVNVVRGNITHGITKNIGKTRIPKNIDGDPTSTIKRVLICRPNHRLGNLLLITPLLQEVISTFPDCKVDLLIKGNLGAIIFENYENVEDIIKLPRKPFSELINYFRVWFSLRNKKYDLVINTVKESSSGKLLTLIAKAPYKISDEFNDKAIVKSEDHEHIAKNAVYSLRNYLNKIGVKSNNNAVPTLNLELSATEIENGKKIIKDLFKNDKKTISIFTFATGNKCYPESWWMPFYDRLKTEYQQDYNILEILPFENVSQIKFEAHTFYSKDIREIGAVMANTAIFIGADSGIMHLASSALIPTLGLFWVTNPKMYHPYGNSSLAIETNDLGIDDYIIEIDKILKKS